MKGVLKHAVVFIGGVILGAVLTLCVTCGTDSGGSVKEIRTELKIIYGGLQSARSDIAGALDYNRQLGEDNTEAEREIKKARNLIEKLRQEDRKSRELDTERTGLIRHLRKGAGD